MANHGFVTTRKKLTTEQVVEDIKEISNRRFRGLVTCEADEYGNIEIRLPPLKFPLQAWVTTPHKFEIRHEMSDLLWWVDAVVLNELALKYNGTISDEGVEEKWKGEEGKYLWFKDWVEVSSRRMDEKTLKFCLDSALRSLPPELKSLWAETPEEPSEFVPFGSKYNVFPFESPFTIREVPCEGYKVVITEGGMTVMGEAFTFDCKNTRKLISGPIAKLTDEQLEDFAKKGLAEYRDFASKNAIVAGVDRLYHE